MQLPGRHTCSGAGSLTRTSIPDGENTEVEECTKRSSWRQKSTGNLDRVPVGEAQWINEKNFTNPSKFRKQMKQDYPVEQSIKPQPLTSASLIVQS